MSKIVNANKKIENIVVGNYKKIETTTVNAYKKIEDKFVDTFLRRDGETIEEAKVRITKEQQELKAKQDKMINNNRRWRYYLEEIIGC